MTGPELVHVSEKNLSQIENVHGFVSHSHISPVKVGIFKVIIGVNCFDILSRNLICEGGKNACVIPASVFLFFYGSSVYTC